MRRHRRLLAHRDDRHGIPWQTCVHAVLTASEPKLSLQLGKRRLHGHDVDADADADVIMMLMMVTWQANALANLFIL